MSAYSFDKRGLFTVTLSETDFNGPYSVAITSWNNNFDEPCFVPHMVRANTYTFSADHANPASDPPSQANPSIEITVIVSFRRDGTILGHPKITYESEQATDHDRLIYRIAVMETLQRCTPMPFTEAMAGAVAGRPFAVKFHNRRPPPQPMEKRAWQLQRIL